MLIGSVERIEAKIKDLGLNLADGTDIEIVDPHTMDRCVLSEDLHKRIGRDGISAAEADRWVRNDRTVLANLLLAHGMVDAVICGTGGRFGHQLDMVEKTIGRQDGVRALSTLNELVMAKGTIFIADAYANLDPATGGIADIAVLSANAVRKMGVRPRAALISHANFGDRLSPSALKMRQALDLLREKSVDFEVDGEMHVNAALDPAQRKRAYA